MTLDLTAAAWRKSSYSAGGGTNCVEVADSYLGIVPVRDSKLPDGPVVVFGSAPWASFLRTLRAGSSTHR
ncbi:DUF397 domain-containing protein [Streptomyces sp. NPDC051243]|uniref:DUF397 domain-containing protein n=1 Tax=Streptomyces sp. NPDC051243 TaxID=3365646 RepID=UPI003791D71E